MAPFGAQKEATIGEIWGIWKLFLSQTTAWMHWYLVWSNLGTRRCKCVQI